MWQAVLDMALFRERYLWIGRWQRATCRNCGSLWANMLKSKVSRLLFISIFIKTLTADVTSVHLHWPLQRRRVNSVYFLTLSMFCLAHISHHTPLVHLGHFAKEWTTWLAGAYRMHWWWFVRNHIGLHLPVLHLPKQAYWMNCTHTEYHVQLCYILWENIRSQIVHWTNGWLLNWLCHAHHPSWTL